MTLVNRDNQAILTVVSQSKLNKTDTVYNFEVAEFHTYHIGEFGTWVHNAYSLGMGNIKNAVETSVTGTGKLHNITEEKLKQNVLDIGYNKIELEEVKNILNHSITVRKAEKRVFGTLDQGHKARIAAEERILLRVNNMLKELK